MPLFLIRLVQVHESFRKAELKALAELADIDIGFVSYHEDSPFCILELPSESAARTLVSRAILAHGIYELWGTGDSYPELHASLHKTASGHWPQYRTTPFKFTFDFFQGTRPPSEQRQLIESFSYMAFEGPIQMKDPPLEITVFEHYPPKDPTPTQLYIGRFIAASGRSAKTTYDLKKRHYISTTSMDAELALITANIAQAAPGKVFYDPFMGTGGFPIACANFGAMVWGSDIDGRSIRGTGGAASEAARKEKKEGKAVKRDVEGNFKQYGLLSNYLGAIVSDLTNTPLRGAAAGGKARGGKESGGWLDGIVCDPPYGVREGLKVLGSRDKLSTAEKASHEDRYKEPTYIPPKKPYSFTLLLTDILTFASDTLVPCGHLSMWMPTANDEEQPSSSTPTSFIPTHPNLELVSVCVQRFNKWSRRLLTYRRLEGDFTRDQNIEAGIGEMVLDGDGDREKGFRPSANDLNDFRRKYFEGFKEVQRVISPPAAVPGMEIGMVGSEDGRGEGEEK